MLRTLTQRGIKGDDINKYKYKYKNTKKQIPYFFVYIFSDEFFLLSVVFSR